MSKRLQVVLEDSEYGEIQKIARRNQMTVSEWVRQALRTARRRRAGRDPHVKIDVVRAATHHEFPTGDVDQLLSEIERGYLGDP